MAVITRCHEFVNRVASSKVKLLTSIVFGCLESDFAVLRIRNDLPCWNWHFPPTFQFGPCLELLVVPLSLTRSDEKFWPLRRAGNHVAKRRDDETLNEGIKRAYVVRVRKQVSPSKLDCCHLEFANCGIRK